ncbi:hypothetical protein B0H14DRAFT_2609943 [Mycena olivaceomarginata]|nr:hypothetical protein B0H14DRAFT_2609943 [Mycena olivaceomarginata]
MRMAVGQSDGAADCGGGCTAMLGRGTHPTVNDVAGKVYNRAAPASAPTPAPPSSPVGPVPSPLPPTRPQHMSCTSFDPPSTVHHPLGSLIPPRLPPGFAALAVSHATCNESRLAPHIDADAHAKQQRWQVPTRRHPAAVSVAAHEHIFCLRAQRDQPPSASSSHRRLPETQGGRRKKRNGVNRHGVRRCHARVVRTAVCA